MVGLGEVPTKSLTAEPEMTGLSGKLRFGINIGAILLCNGGVPRLWGRSGDRRGRFGLVVFCPLCEVVAKMPPGADCEET